MEILKTIKTIGFEEPYMMLFVIPAVLILYLYLRSYKSKHWRNYFIARFIIIFLIFAAMGVPFVIIQKPVANSAVTILLDESESMNLYNNFDSDVYDLYDDLKSGGGFVNLNNFSRGNKTAIGDALYISSLNPVENNVIILASDGRNNYGKDMRNVASNIDSGIFSLIPKSTGSDISVSIEGDNYALAGIEQEITVVVKKTGSKLAEYNLNLRIDSENIKKGVTQNENETVKIISFPHTFEKEGKYYISAEITPLAEDTDFFAVNNKFTRNINVIPGPRILFVSKNYKDSPLKETLDSYQTTTINSADEIRKQNLDNYDCVILNDIPASELGNKNTYDAISGFIENGGGLMVVGGNHSYELGGYNGSEFEKILPVNSVPRAGRDREIRIMILIDISGSFTEKGETVLKIEDVKVKAASLVEVMDENDYLGVVAFDDNTYTIQHLKGGDLKYFGERKLYKQELIDKILSFTTTPTQGTIMNKALTDAKIEIGSDGGYVILLSDGRLNFKDDENLCREIAEEMRKEDIAIITVGIGEGINTKFLKELSTITNGTYYEPRELAGLKLEIKGLENKTGGNLIKISDHNHFITRTMELAAEVDEFNKVSKKTGAQVLVAKEGEPIITVWRYGLGRVTAVTIDDGSSMAKSVYGGNLIYRTINWAAGGIGEENGGVSENYPAEYLNLGVNENGLKDISKGVYKTTQVDKLKDDVNEYIKQQRSEVPKREYVWFYFVVGAILLFFVDVCYRRVKEIVKLRNS